MSTHIDIETGRSFIYTPTTHCTCGSKLEREDEIENGLCVACLQKEFDLHKH